MRYISILLVSLIGCSSGGSGDHSMEPIESLSSASAVPICNYSIAWDAVPDIDYYQVWIEGKIYKTRKTHFNISFLPRGRYTFKVRAVNGDGVSSDWSSMIISKRV